MKKNILSLPVHEFEFQFARSSGAGGQNVNKVNSKAILIWNVAHTPFLNSGARERFFQNFSNRINQDGFIVVQSERFRDQPRNVEDCETKLLEMILQIWTPPKIRRATKPTRAAKRKRLESKKIHSDKKQNRKRDW